MKLCGHKWYNLEKELTSKYYDRPFFSMCTENLYNTIEINDLGNAVFMVFCFIYGIPNITLLFLFIIWCNCTL